MGNYDSKHNLMLIKVKLENTLGWTAFFAQIFAISQP